MTEREALFRAILADPDDDVARLVYADWLQEHGDDARAEFIRLQCRLANGSPADAEWAEDRQRERELLIAHGADWLAELPAIDDVKWEPHFERGFPARASIRPPLIWEPHPPGERTPIRWSDRLGAILSASVVRDVSMLAPEPAGNVGAAYTPGTERLRGLRVDYGVGAFREPADGPAAQPDLSGLRQLSLQFWPPMSGDEARKFAPVLESLRLTHFHLGTTDTLTGEEIGALFRNGSDLRELHLEGRGVNDELTARLADGRPFPHLHTLRISYAPMTAEGLRRLAGSGAFPALAELDLYGTPVGPAGAEVLAGADRWCLRALRLRGAQLGSAGTERLADSPNLASLRELTLNGFGAAGTGSLAHSPHLIGLRSLDLGNAHANTRTLLALAESPHRRRLLRLDVGNDGSGPPGALVKDMLEFLDRLDLPELRELRMDHLPVGAMGCRKLLAPRFEQVRALSLRGCRLREGCTKLLVAGLPNLEWLDAKNNGLSPRAERFTRQAARTHR